MRGLTAVGLADALAVPAIVVAAASAGTAASNGTAASAVRREYVFMVCLLVAAQETQIRQDMIEVM